MVGPDCACWNDASFRPYLNSPILEVGGVDSALGVDEDGLWFFTNSVVIGQRDRRRIPCGIRTEVRLIE